MTRIQPKGATLLLLLLLTACNFPTPMPDVEPAPSLEAAAGTVDDVPSPPQAEGPQACPVPSAQPEAFRLENGSRAARDILDFLNEGGSVADARIAVRNWNNSDPQATAVVTADLDGDGWLDVVAAVRISDAMPLESRIYTYQCRDDHYDLTYSSPALLGSHPADLHTTADFSGDGFPDVLGLTESCGAHTCSLMPTLLVWSRGSLSDRWTEATDDLPSPHLDILNPEGSQPSIAITATGIQSAGAGPFRSFRREYSWDEAAATMTAQREIVLPATYRIHMLLDGDEAYDQGDLTTALQAYQRVVEDPALDDWIQGEDGYQRLSAYALFRSILVHLRRGEADLAGSAFQLLQEAYTAGAGRPFADMAGKFWDAFLENGELNAGCLAAQTYAEQHPEDILDPLYYGYANPAYTVSDICPLLP